VHCFDLLLAFAVRAGGWGTIGDGV